MKNQRSTTNLVEAAADATQPGARRGRMCRRLVLPCARLGRLRSGLLVAALLAGATGTAPLHARGVQSAASVAPGVFSAAEASQDAGHRRWRHSLGFYVSPFYWGWSGYYYGWPRAEVWSHPYYSDAWGAVDLNIKPKKAEVFVDGEYVGRVDQFDGFPRYLWLERGTRHLVIYKEGYESLALRIRARPGQVLDLRETLAAGQAKTPEELFAQLDAESPDSDTDRSARRVARRSERRAIEPDDESWRNPAPSRSTSSVAEDQRQAPGRLVVNVIPTDAVVYLDGRLLGSGDELARLHHGLMVDGGTHVVEVARPGYETETREIRVASGEETVLDFSLVAERR